MIRSQLPTTSAAVSGEPSENSRLGRRWNVTLLAVRRDLPARGEGGLERQRGVVGGEGLVELGDDRRGAGVAGRCRVEGRGLVDQDLDVVAAGCRREASVAHQQERGDDRERTEEAPDAAATERANAQARPQSGAQA